MHFLHSRVLSTIVARCERGEDLFECLTRLVREHDVRNGSFQAIGAVRRARLGIFEDGKYEWVEHDGALEIASCTGNAAVKEGVPFVHAHAVLADHRGTVLAGHVGEGNVVDPTAEIHLHALEGAVSRSYDAETGLWLLDIR